MNAKKRAHLDAIDGMTAKVCLRCDWQGETKGSTCSNCGVLLYVAGATRAKTGGPQTGDDRSDVIQQPTQSLTSRLDPPASPVTEAASRRSNGPAAAFVIAALVLIVTFDAVLRSDGATPTTAETPDTNLGDVFAAPIAELDVPAWPTGVGPIEELPGSIPCSTRCRRELTVGRVPLSFRVPTPGWEAFGDISINKSIVGPQGAEAIIYWTTIPGDYANPCVDVLGMPVPRSVRALAAEVATAPGTELLAGPSNVLVGGRRGKHVELHVDQDLGCDPGYFFIWHDMEAGALWPATEVGHRISVWVVDVGQTPVFIAAVTSEEATEGLQQQIGVIIRSIRFEALPGA